MKDALVFAKCLYDLYFERKQQKMDQMKMHKLMYFLQREALMKKGMPLFDEPFYGWKFGPVLKSVRTAYQNNAYDPFEMVDTCLDANDMSLVKAVLERYADLGSWKLSELSHSEYSWNRARTGLQPSENGDRPLDLNAMKVDAARESAARRKLYG